MRSEYRFPRSVIVLMLLVLVGVVAAIEQTRKFAAGDASALEGWLIVRIFGAAFGSMLLAGAAGYAILRALGHTGSGQK